MVYKYIATNNEGVKVRGIITAENEEEADKIVKARGVTVIRMEAVKAAVSDSPNYFVRERSAHEKMLAHIFITKGQLEIALEQLGTMIEGGVPIVNSFQTVASQSSHYLSRALFCVANKLQQGRPLGEVIREELPFLGNIVIGLIQAGEANGDVDKMCMYAVELMARSRKLKGQVLQALTYPVLVILVTICIVTFLMVMVIPKIMNFLTNKQAGLPPITQALVDVTHFLQGNWFYFVLVPIVFFTVIGLLRKNPSTGVTVDYILLRIPVLGKVFRASSNMLWCRTLGILLRSGINIIPAMNFTIDALGNWFYRSELEEMKKIIAQGHPLSTALRVSGIKSFVSLADSMLVVGENTGRIDSGLLKVADFSDTDLQKRIAFLSKMIEPALFVIVGGIVGFVYIAFFMGLMAASTGKA